MEPAVCILTVHGRDLIDQNPQEWLKESPGAFAPFQIFVQPAVASRRSCMVLYTFSLF